MSTLDYVAKRFNLNLRQRAPIIIPNFGRKELARMLYYLDFRKAVEVGVAAGQYSETLASANPQMEIHGIDPWSGQKGYRDYTRGETFNRLLEDAHARLDKFPNYHFIRDTSLNAAKGFTDNSIDFVYIDADHSFRQVTQDIDEWLKKVKPGGILAGHDYAYTKGNARMHVKYVLPAYMSAWKLSPWFILGNDATDEGLIRDKPRSWMYIKP